VRYFEKCVQPEEEGLMIKQLLAPLSLSKRLRKMLMEPGGLQVNGLPAFWSARVKTGDRIILEAVEDPSEQIIPERLPLSVLYEDEHVLVIDKQAGVVVHPTGKYQSGTLVAAVAYYMLERNEQCRCRPLHRLDRETSGVLLFAKHKLAHERLIKALHKREVVREYIAFVEGWLPFVSRRLDLPLLRPCEHSLKRAVAPYGKPAVTFVRVLRRFAKPRATLCAITLETGRTHQIRVHMSYLGHPVIADWLYGNAPSEQSELPIRRHALHAAQLTFPHPFSGAIISVCAPLPSDLQELTDALDQIGETKEDVYSV